MPDPISSAASSVEPRSARDVYGFTARRGSLLNMFGTPTMEEAKSEVTARAMRRFQSLVNAGQSPERAFLKLLETQEGSDALLQAPELFESIANFTALSTEPTQALSPGQKLVGARSGDTIASNPPSDVQSFEYFSELSNLDEQQLADVAGEVLKQSAKGKPTEPDKTYAMLVEQGYPDKIAEKIARGVIQVKSYTRRNENGEVIESYPILVDVAEMATRGQAHGVAMTPQGPQNIDVVTLDQVGGLDQPAEGAQPAVGIPEPAPEIIPATEAVAATGFVPLMREIATLAGGQFDPGTTDADDRVVKYRGSLRQLNEDVLNYFKDADRTALPEQERILEMSPDLGIFENPNSALDDLENMYASVNTVVERNRAIANNVEGETKTRRVKAANLVSQGEILLQRIGTPEQIAEARWAYKTVPNQGKLLRFLRQLGGADLSLPEEAPTAPTVGDAEFGKLRDRYIADPDSVSDDELSALSETQIDTLIKAYTDANPKGTK